MTCDKNETVSTETFGVIAKFSGKDQKSHGSKSPIPSDKMDLKNLDEITFSSSEDSQDGPILNINWDTIDSRPTSENGQVKISENASQNVNSSKTR